MRWVVALGVIALFSCTHEEPLPPVPPPPDDLSAWSVPDLVQPAVPTPLPPAPAEEKPTAAEKVFAFTPGGTYAVPVALGVPLVLTLAPGEQVRNIVSGAEPQAPPPAPPAPAEPGQPAAPAPPQPQGQTQRWTVKEGASGSGETQRAQIFLTVTEPGLTLGLVVSTSQRTYLLTLKSVRTSPVRVVRWTYSAVASVVKPEEHTTSILPDLTKPTLWHVGYSIEAKGPPPDWMPRGAWDDGKKLYLVLPVTTRYGIAPLVRGIVNSSPTLINSRHYQDVIIIDQLLPRLELRVGTAERAEVVIITRTALRTIACPEDQACPAWRATP